MEERDEIENNDISGWQRLYLEIATFDENYTNQEWRREQQEISEIEILIKKSD